MVNENMTLDELIEYRKSISKKISTIQHEERMKDVNIIKGVLTTEWQSTGEIYSKVKSKINHDQNWVCNAINRDIKGLEHRMFMTVYVHSHADKVAQWRLSVDKDAIPSRWSGRIERDNIVHLVCTGTTMDELDTIRNKWAKKHYDYEYDGHYHYNENGDCIFHFTRKNDGVARDETVDDESYFYEPPVQCDDSEETPSDEKDTTNDPCLCVKIKYGNITHPETINTDGGEVQDLEGCESCIFIVKEGTKRVLLDSDNGIRWKPVEDDFLTISKKGENITAAYLGYKRYVVCPTLDRVKIVEVELI